MPFQAAAVIDISFLSWIVGLDDAPLGRADEIENRSLFLRIREPCLNLGTAICDVVALEIDGVIDILDIPDNIS